MVRLSFIHAASDHVGDHIVSIPLGIGLFVMASAVVALCASHGRRASRKDDHVNKTFDSRKDDKTFDLVDKDDYYEDKLPPGSPLRSPKQLITTISNKAMNSLVINHKRGGGGGGGDRVVEEGFGQGGLWQKEILMGVKCQPPEFSGVIYYDCDGKQVSEFPPRSPRSPRIAPSPEFTFPAIKSPV
ncbi:hypothetical protein L1987_57363 [Smallanthus sonchifolius]|uniref:Uncharacterized protein n=1 Tax=Smallanthus sonchifolius TaxID=185202 RepID=A0ACB9DCR7_9ASTR|nr:hypothetical protein L1987_57363 [Smallanthus sonchifolius]